MPSWPSARIRGYTLRRAVGAALAFLLGGFLAWLVLPKPGLYPDDVSFSHALSDSQGRIVHLALTADAKYRLHTSLANICPAVVEATLLLEDQHFRTHPGVNPFSMLRAVAGACTGSRRGGGSTITMQLARLRFRLVTRSFVGKCVQLLRALQLERHYTKDEILEAYLNLAPYGGNVEGIGAASLLWCGKSASELTAREAVSLSVLPQSPTKRRPLRQRTNVAQASAQFRLWQRWQSARGMRVDALDASFSLRWEGEPPRGAPHLARRLFADGTKETVPNTSRPAVVASTLDSVKQHTLEQTLRDFLTARREVGMTNACAILVHAPTRDVLAYVGSASFLDGAIQGQVDGVAARRSPGSALKPFIYAIALQQGLLHPQTLVRDGQVTFGDYNPENFDREFTGPITATNALFRSRNIPAVTLARRLAAPGLYGFLQHAGVSLTKPAEHYGLALPLGGAEVSMEELASLYAMLADDGTPRRVRFLRDMDRVRAAPRTERLLTPEACFLVRRMLASREGEEGLSDPTISWKTGTSHGFRDAWAVGIRGDYVLAVWIGNFNGESNPSFVARKCAAPLLFEGFHRLRLPYRQDLPPPGVSEVELCAVSGQMPSPHCEHRQVGWFIPGVSPIEPCAIHREILIDSATGMRVLVDDGKRVLRREVFEFWPPDLLSLFRAAGVPRREAPSLEPSQSAMRSALVQDAPRIVSPQSRLVYALRAGDATRQSIPLRAETAAGVRAVFWFAGAKFLGSCVPSGVLFWKATPGDWKLHVLDDQGRSASCALRVEMVE